MLFRSVTDFAPDDIKRAKELLGKYDMRVSVVDTPYFKTLLPGTQSRFSEAKGDRLQSDFSQQAAVLERAFARAKDFATDKVRIFSFLRVADPHTVFDRVAKELEKTADAAKQMNSPATWPPAPRARPCSRPYPRRRLVSIGIREMRSLRAKLPFPLATMPSTKSASGTCT